ncbi:hypothetical protein [Rhizobium leguminosarum]|uniref:hypothetical protein n=1 Tax=Rhizobium leguminosarum TaxID=384 RepID=UPI001C93A87F|nr:hypothetical protein [Rhizobium leguminosarum]
MTSKRNKSGMARAQIQPPESNPYVAPSRRRLDPKLTGPAPSQVAIQAIEVCQAIQSIDGSVTLVADKATLVRVYIDQLTLASGVRLAGEIKVRNSTGAPATYVAALADVTVDPKATPTRLEQRNLIQSSLNFRLPSDATKTGKLLVEVNRIWLAGGSDLTVTGTKEASATFVSAPPLRLRCIGLRYRDNATGQAHAPDAVHFAYLRSFLERAYPVPSVEWSQIVVDANFIAPFNDQTVLKANAQIAAIRSSEVNNGMDPRTHYLALVDDARGKNFMRGRAMGIPAAAAPDTVASSPCGVPNGFAGDNDLSYSDWYGAHELGHTFGRYHPGFPRGAQDASDKDFPYQNGQLSNDDQKFVGYDLGDSTLGIPLQALSGTHHHDLMTYAERQWICAHTFEAIRSRLIEEDEQFALPIA